MSTERPTQLGQRPRPPEDTDDAHASTRDALRLFDLPDISSLRKFARFVDILRWHHHGRDNAIPVSQIADQVGMSDTTLKDWKQVAIAELGLPIVSCQDGYFIAESEQELERARDSHLSAAATHAETARQLDRAFYGTVQPRRGDRDAT